MTTAFQTVIDNAESISFNRRRSVAQTQSRDGTVRSTSLGAQVWRFEVKLPNGPRWSDYRGLIEKMEALDRVTVGTIQINQAAHSWLTGYQGNAANPATITASYASGNTITLTAGQAASGYNFKSGDLIQLGSSGSVYSVVNDVAFNSNTVTLHRPVLEAAGSYTLIVGQNVTWSVICTEFPQWTIFARDQVGWAGSFVFVEDLT
jgi:hypothetical protein